MDSSRTSPSTNLGPLTTTFTPPSDCDRITVGRQADDTRTDIYYTTGRYYPSFPGVASCFPSRYLEGSDDSSGYDKGGYYSPGICPSGWQGIHKQNSSPETTIICCPISLTPTADGSVYFCSWGLTTTSIGPMVFFSQSFYLGPATDMPPFTTSVSTLVPSQLSGLAYGTIQVRYKEGDFPTTSLSTQIQTTSLSTQIQTATAGPQSTSGQPLTTTPSSTTSTSSSSENAGLSQGTKIGIGVGISLTVILLLICVGLFYIRRRRGTELTDASQNEALGDVQYDDEHKAELPDTVPTGNIIEKALRKPELDTVISTAPAVAEPHQESTKSTYSEVQELYSSEARPLPIELSSLPADRALQRADVDSAPQARASELDNIASRSADTPASSTHRASVLPTESKTEAGPLPSASDLYPVDKDRQDEEEDLIYQERRLREKRELVAEKERLAAEKEKLANEEDKLRERRAAMRNK